MDLDIREVTLLFIEIMIIIITSSTRMLNNT